MRENRAECGSEGSFQEEDGDVLEQGWGNGEDGSEE